MKPERAALVLSLSVCLAAPALTGCRTIARTLGRKATEKTIEESSGAKEVSLEKEGLRFEGKEGEKVAIGGSARLPDGWPSYAPVYPGAKLHMAIANPGQKAKVISMETADAPDKALAFYKERLTGAAWTVETTLDLGGTHQSSFARPNTPGATASVMAAATEGAKTMVTVSIVE
jgi:hypothetical protein